MKLIGVLLCLKYVIAPSKFSANVVAKNEEMNVVGDMAGFSVFS
jgi:hypothetical protein